jgi:nicotinate-nucleotide adenylyltransferase
LKRIALFGGSFDPVHAAHVALAGVALSQLGLDELRWVPAGRQWQKHRDLTPAVHRAAMVRLAIAGEPRFVLEDCELRRSGASYTYDTVRELQAAEPGAEWFLVIGQDQYAGLHSWVRWQEMLQRVTLAVANRPGVTVLASPEVQAVPHRVVPLPMMDVSSTEIRARVARGLAVDDLVPAPVARYIAQHALYQGDLIRS